MHFVNVTPHTVNIIDADGAEHAIASSGSARIATSPGEREVVDRFVFFGPTTFGKIIDLPDAQEGVIFIASMLVAQAAAKLWRCDVVSPDSGPTAIRFTEADEAADPSKKKGQIKAVCALCRW